MYPHIDDPHKYPMDHGLPYSHVEQQPYYAPASAPPYMPSDGVMAYGVGGGKWTTAICHCCDNPRNCFRTCFCPCVTFGRIAEIVDRRAKGRRAKNCGKHGAIYGLLCCLTGFACCLYSCSFRTKLRAQFELEKSPCGDCPVHFFCPTCALCQEYRELQNQGFDLDIGYEANIQRQRYGPTAPPIIAPGMTR